VVSTCMRPQRARGASSHRREAIREAIREAMREAIRGNQRQSEERRVTVGRFGEVRESAHRREAHLWGEAGAVVSTCMR